MASLPTWRCRLAPGRAPWWLVWQLRGSCPQAPRSPCHGETERKTRSSELHPGHRTQSRATHWVPSIWTSDSGEMIFGSARMWIKRVCVCVWATLLGSCECYTKPLLWVWEGLYTLNPPKPPPPLQLLEHSTAPCWPPLLHKLHCRPLA